MSYIEDATRRAGQSVFLQNDCRFAAMLVRTSFGEFILRYGSPPVMFLLVILGAIMWNIYWPYFGRYSRLFWDPENWKHEPIPLEFGVDCWAIGLWTGLAGAIACLAAAHLIETFSRRGGREMDRAYLGHSRLMSKTDADLLRDPDGWMRDLTVTHLLREPMAGLLLCFLAAPLSRTLALYVACSFALLWYESLRQALERRADRLHYQEVLSSQFYYQWVFKKAEQNKRGPDPQLETFEPKEV